MNLDGEFYHLLVLQLGTRNVDQDVADAEPGRGGQFEHQTRIEPVDGLDEILIGLFVRPIRFVRFIQNHGRTDEFQDVDETVPDPIAAFVFLQIGALLCKAAVRGCVILLGKEGGVPAAVPEYFEKILAPLPIGRRQHQQ